MDDLECLLGMDIINMGDLAITNYQGKTVYSFRIPSVQAIDFVEETKKLKEKQFSKTGRNQPCPCGSGKIFKRCCGPKYGKF
ncbi:MAG: hypothetical protein FJY10_07835 [Bacteroidetes bacterium]|nr:hypothetical protein [Bacteroidota bacterium]